MNVIVNSVKSSAHSAVHVKAPLWFQLEKFFFLMARFSLNESLSKAKWLSWLPIQQITPYIRKHFDSWQTISKKNACSGHRINALLSSWPGPGNSSLLMVQLHFNKERNIYDWWKCVKCNFTYFWSGWKLSYKVPNLWLFWGHYWEIWEKN